MYRERSILSLALAALCVLLAVVLLRSATIGDSLALEKYTLRGARVYVIRADLNDPRIRVDIGLPAKGLAHSESFEAMVRRRAPLAAVTGTYFCTRSLIPVGTIVIGGRKVHVSRIGNTVYFLGSTQVRFVDTAKGQDCDFTGAYCGLRTGPRLLNAGRYALSPAREGFRHPGLFGAHLRMALGVTSHNKLLLVYVATPVTFARTASIMKALGAVDAICLDGGTSAAMYYRGRLVHRPGRALTNVIEVRLAPAGAPVAVSDVRIDVVGLQATQSGPAADEPAFRRSARSPDRPESAGYEEVAALDAGVLRLAKGWHPFFPVNRAKLPRLEGLEDANHLVHVAADVKIVHHLVA
jgi:hypothetical protein